MFQASFNYRVSCLYHEPRAENATFNNVTTLEVHRWGLMEGPFITGCTTVLTGRLFLLFSYVNTSNCLQIHDAADVNQSSTLAKLVCLHVQWCETKFQIPSIFNKL